MTSDRFSSSQPDVTFKPAGVGHASGWRCETCKRQFGSYLGRKKLRIGFRCAGCVAEVEALKAEAEAAARAAQKSAERSAA